MLDANEEAYPDPRRIGTQLGKHTEHINNTEHGRAEMLPWSSTRPAAVAAFTQPQLRQMRAQCLVFLAFKNQMEPRKRHLQIALGEDEIDGVGCHGEVTTSEPSSQASSSSVAPLPLPHLLPISSLRLSSPPSVTGQEQENRHGNDDPEAKHE